MSLKNIYARVDQECFEKINALAEMRAISTSELIRGIVVAFFNVDAVNDDDSTVKQMYADATNPSLPNVNHSLEIEVSQSGDSIELDW